MSHVATVDLAIKDLACLKKAAENLGLEYRQNQKNYKWFGRWVNDYHGENAAHRHGIKTEDYGKCDHAIGIPNNKAAYEIGVVKSKTKEGEHTLIWDFWGQGQGLQSYVGDGCGKLCQQYSKEVATKKAMEMGYTISQKTQEDGSIVLTLGT